jgi:hypothetical protein
MVFLALLGHGPKALSYARFVLDGIGTKEYNIYYSPNLLYTKDLTSNVFAQVGATYNIGFVSHYHNDVSGVDEKLPSSTSYEGMIKLGYNVTKSIAAIVFYNRTKYIYAGNDTHYNTEANLNYTSIGPNYSF